MAGTSNPNRYCVVLVGQTGLGKSSFIRILSRNGKVQSSDGVISHTQEPQLFRDHVKERCWVDTRGTSDSDEKIDDTNSMRTILRLIQENDIDAVKVVWMVPCASRMNAILQPEARFISSFGEESSSWESVLVVVNKGNNMPGKSSGAPGAIEAAQENGASETSIQTIGINVLNWGDDATVALNHGLYDLTPLDARMLGGLLWEDEVVEHMNELVERIPPIRMHFEELQCESCGVRGDPRCVDVNCHPPDHKRMYHPREKMLVHTAEAKLRHPGALKEIKWVHRSGGMTHTRLLTDVQNGIEKYHPRPFENRVSKSHKWFLWVEWDHQTTKYTRCKECYKCDPGTSEWQHGCETRATSRSEYPCCGGSSSSSGCSHACCNRLAGSTGCIQKVKRVEPNEIEELKSDGTGTVEWEWACCGSDKDGEGCEEFYPCCGAKVGSGRGCAYDCCKEKWGDFESEGCEAICRGCKEPWGKSRGCSIPRGDVIYHIMSHLDGNDLEESECDE